MRAKTLKKLLIAAAVIAVAAGAVFASVKFAQWYGLEHCRHKVWADGVCTHCGEQCPHTEYANGVCTVCGIDCPHDWENGVCAMCGMVCSHLWTEDGCDYCGMNCPHDWKKNGFCAMCGKMCLHQWEDGVCSVCSMECSHSEHDAESQLCAVCGEKVVHNFVAGRCACGAEPLLYSEFLPEEYFAECDEKGEIADVSYYAPYYAFDGEIMVGKVMSVYLPYGYDESEKYNVMVLLHGGSGNNSDWMQGVIQFEDGDVVCMRNLYDNMIKDRIIEPMIIVTPYTDSYVFGGGFADTGAQQLGPELRDIIMPYIAEHYSTYAENGSIEALSAAREHFGIGGNSNGSLNAYNAGLVENLDLFANFMCISGSNNARGVVEALESKAFSSLPVDFLYAGAGTTDPQNNNVLVGFQHIVENTPRLIEGENALCFEIKGGHDWKTWSTSFFNAMQLLFPVQ